MGALARIVAVVQPRWSGAAVRDPHHRHRRAHRSLRQPLPRRSRPRRPLLRVIVRVHGSDARRRSQRQHPHAVRVLGAHRLHVVPAHRLRTRAGRRSSSRTTGVDCHRRRRPGAAGGGCAAPRCVWHREPLRHGDAKDSHRRQSILWLHRGLDSPRSIHEIRSSAIPLLAAERDGGANTGERIPPLRHDGEGRRVPHCEDDSCRRLDALVDDGGNGGRRGNDDRRGLSLGAGNRSEAHPRLLDAERAWRADDAARRGHARGHRRGAGVPGRACLLQGRAVPRRRRNRPRSRYARYLCACGSAPNDAHHRACRWCSCAVDGRGTADTRIRRQGRSLRGVASRCRLVSVVARPDGARQYLSRTGGIDRWGIAISRRRGAGEGGARPSVAAVDPTSSSSPRAA